MSEFDDIRWNADGLVPVVTQDDSDGTVLMHAWMNRDALAETLKRGEAVYWSRSRQALWRKGESSGHVQKIREVRLDCDADTLLLRVHQVGGIACHTGRAHCFFRRYVDGTWQETDAVLRTPEEIYGKRKPESSGK